MPTVEVLNGPEVGQKTILTGEVFFIGRDSNNHLPLTDRTVSRKHAVINHIEGEYVLSDLKSLRGVLINGVKKEEAILQDGDEIALGAIRISFWKEDKGGGTVTRRQSKKRLFLFLVIVLALGLTIPLLLRLANQLPKQGDEHLLTLERHYQQGVEFFNQDKDFEGAKQEWETVLKLDPEKKTPFGRKASKLLENLR